MRQLQNGEWQPQFVLAHNDLWLGNVLHAPAGGKYPFAIIDWLGASTRGYAIYDLVRLAQSTGLARNAIAVELESHRALLECRREQLQFYLLAALGSILLNLEAFPRERFNVMAGTCWETLQAAINSC